MMTSVNRIWAGQMHPPKRVAKEVAKGDKRFRIFEGDNTGAHGVIFQPTLSTVFAKPVARAIPCVRPGSGDEPAS